ncbi:serine dehydratase subunit alpha family protein [Histomonas meleagridis]|uniref:serine dehydratase subunit alpha family protein n=1 Tax=Histomonas meleagridis TaxID=135588 RepID=UPI00355948F8|nr:serine dehydratase subunit alpha family protein [Histomonas meleagridis]KAH0803657.1 serine dehydratase subunit alpha family protein [Histomonas meleagridis]
MLAKEEMIRFLHKEVSPALGCTEPVCVAIAAADAAKAIGAKVERIDVIVSPGIFKNGMSVAIPGFDKVGLAYAAALGAYIKQPEKKLQIFEAITPEISNKAKELVESGLVNVQIDKEKKKIFVSCCISTEYGTGISKIVNSHTNIVLTQSNGKTIYEKPLSEEQSDDTIINKLSAMKISEIRALASSATEQELSFLLDGVKMNDEVANFGLNNEIGVGIASSIQNDIGTALSGEGLMSIIMLKVASSIESRLDGCQHSVMSSAGAGSKGLALIIPLSETARYLGTSNEKFLQALAFGHLLNSYINIKIGKLSPLCTCSCAASTASSAAMTLLFGGNDEQIGHAIRNMTGSVTGMICDGGKVGCALKLAMASVSAFLCARMAIQGAALRESDGICAKTPEECIENMSRIGVGMENTDLEILNVMSEK